MLKIPIGIIVAKEVSFTIVAKELESNSTPFKPPTNGRLTHGKRNVMSVKMLMPKIILTNIGVEPEVESVADFDRIDIK
jgi:hypothetical protein